MALFCHCYCPLQRTGYPIAFVEARQRLALEFGQRLRRYTGLNHLVQAANAVLENAAHVRQMVDDFDKVCSMTPPDSLSLRSALPL